MAAIVICPDAMPVRFPLKSGRLYDVSVDQDGAQFDLPFRETGEQYLLQVSNLATSLDPVVVTFSAQPVENVKHIPLTRQPRWKKSVAQQKPPVATYTAPVGRAKKRRRFWLPVTGGSAENPAAYREIVAELAGQGRRLRVYVDRDDRVESRTVENIVHRFESSVRPTVEHYLGSPTDVDGDGVFTILLTSWLDRLDGGRVALGGMVSPNDFRTELDPPFSNRADLLYLNASVRPGDHLETLLAHEFAHAVTCSGRQANGSILFGAYDEEGWINEAIAHVAENLHSDNWSNLDHRVARFLSAPQRAPLVVASYRKANLWRDAGSRGATYLFMRWCVEQFGIELLPRLIHSQLRGIANLEAATGVPFAELHRNYSADLFLRTVNGENARTASAGGAHLPSVDLAAPLGDWGLAGPRFDAWDTELQYDTPEPVMLRGTTTRHVVLSTSRTGPKRITVRAGQGAQLQVTLVRLPRRLARLRLRVVAAAEGGWRLQVSEESGLPVELSHVAWETDEPGRLRPGMATQVCLDRQRLSQAFDNLSLPGGATLSSRPIAFRGMPRGRLTVRLVGVDRQGHRVASWTRVDLGASTGQLAARQATVVTGPHGSGS